MSFTRAAAELNVTQAAVSKKIRALERHIGVSLFARRHRSIELTAEGRKYLHTVVAALSHVSHATAELRPEQAMHRLTIAADQSVAALQLMPRLGALMEELPDVTLHLVVSDEEARLLAEEVDVAILHGDGRWQRHESTLLFPEVVFPVCSPDFLASTPPITGPEDLAETRLIDLEDDNWTWINWRIWLSSHGVGLPATHRALTIGNYPLVLEAARQGLGVALAWQHQLAADLASGRLVRPIAAEVATRFGYYLAWPRSRQRPPEAAAFCDWLRAEIGRAEEGG
jgi:DNA-binding transcriptional LysR family regulator